MHTESRPILVTGGHGFLGSHLVKALLDEKAQVAIMARAGADLIRLKEKLPHIQHLPVDLTDFEKVRAVVKELNPRGVFHLAAATVASGVRASSATVVNTNLRGTENLLEATRDIDYDFFITSGTFLEYGMRGRPVKESDRCDPPELYSITKLGATLLGQAYAREYKKPIVTFRLGTVFGPAMPDDRLLSRVIDNALHNREIKMTQPEVTRDFIYVEDVVRLLLEARVRAKVYGGEIFNAGSGRAVSFQTVIDRVLRLTESKSKVSWGAFPSVSYDSDIWQLDMEKTFKHFAWRPRHTFDEGVATTIDQYRASLKK